MENEIVQVIQPENVSQEVISLLTKAEIDSQISTAKAFPRSIKGFMEKVRSIATVNEAVASSCGYSLKRQGTTITGPSVRFAEIVVSSYGNIRAAARVVANDGKTITAQGICHDLETNTVATIEVKRRITDKYGKTFSEDMQVVTGNAACAIAYRNAVFKVVPAALTEDIFEDVMKVAKGTLATLTTRREKAIQWFVSMGVKPEQVYKKLEVKGMEDIDLDKLHLLNGFKTAIKNQESTLAEIFAEDEPGNNPQDNKEEQRMLKLIIGKSAEEIGKIRATIPADKIEVFDRIVKEQQPPAPTPEPKPAKASAKPKEEEAAPSMSLEDFKKMIDDAAASTGDALFIETFKKAPTCDTDEKRKYVMDVVHRINSEQN